LEVPRRKDLPSSNGRSQDEALPAADSAESTTKTGSPPAELSAAKHTWEPIPLDGDEDDDTPPQLILGLFYPDRRQLLYGEPESGKTWLALCAAVEVMNQGNRVLWIDHEMDRRQIRQRLRALGCSARAIKGLFTYLQPCEALHEDADPAYDS